MFIQVFNNSKYLGSVTGLDKLKEKTQRIEDYEWKISFSVSHIKYKKCIFGMHQQKVNWSFTALPSFWRTFREFFDSRSRLTSKSRQEPGKVWKCRNLALCDLPNFVLFVLFERIWVSCGSWELTKHTNKQQTLQFFFFTKSNSTHWQRPSARAWSWSWSWSWSFLIFFGLLLACWASPIVHHLPWPPLPLSDKIPVCYISSQFLFIIIIFASCI